MKISIVVLLLVACVPPRVPVKGPDGPVCKGASYDPAVPCVEAGQPAPKGGLLVDPELAREWLIAPAEKQAENDSLRKSNATDVMLVGLAVAAILAAGIGGFELGHAVK